MSRPITSRLAALVAGAVLVLTTGCVKVPMDGPVEETQFGGDSSTDPGVFIDPRPPQAGESPTQIVDHFLDAMQATPIQTRTAKEFLSRDAAAAWEPDLETITYAEPPVAVESPNGVSVTLRGANRLDERGAWKGALPAEERTLTFPMVMEGGEWRIEAAPNALIVPQGWFESRYRPVSLYFFDPTASILAPEPVFVPTGDGLATSLMRKLVKGPGEDLRRVVQSFIPADLEVQVGVSVSKGVATVPLQGDAQFTAETTELMLAQLAWTLRQDPAITHIQVTLNGDPLPLPGGVATYRVDGGGEYDPAGFQSSPLLHALRDGRVVVGTATSQNPVDGPLGTQDYGLESIGVSLDAGTLAGVAAGGTALLTGSLDTDARQQVSVVLDNGTDLLRPAWDFANRLWAIDRTAAGARVLYGNGEGMRELEVPGMTGQRIRSFLVSRDGTRLVAVERRGGRDVLIVSRIRHSATGRVAGATPAERIGPGAIADRPVRSIAWVAPERVAVLVPLAARLASVGRITVDGAPVGRESVAVPIDARLQTLAGSPDADEPLYGLARRTLVNINNQQETEIAAGTSALVYVG